MAVRVDRLGAAAEVLQRHAQVERRGAVVWSRFQRAPVELGCAPRLARLVQQPAEIDQRLRVAVIELERALVRCARRRGIGLFQIASALVETVRVEGVGRLAREWGDAARQLGGAEIEEHLPVLGAPAARAVADDDAVALGADVHASERPPFGELIAQLAKGRLHSPRRNARRHQPLCRAQQDEILKREAQLAARAACRAEKARAHPAAHLRDREAEHGGDLAGAVAQHWGSKYHIGSGISTGSLSVPASQA